MKRKVIIFCLLIALILTALSAFAACESDPIVGTWVAEDGSKLIYKNDGTAQVLFASGTEWTFTWEYTTKYSEDLPYTLYNENGAPVWNMNIDDDGTIFWYKMVFTKQ